MTGHSTARVAAIVAKDLAELRVSKGVLFGPLAMLATAVIMPLAVAVWLPSWSASAMDTAAELAEMARQQSLPGATTLDDAALAQVLLLHQFLPLLALVPVVGALTIVTTAIVGERQARTLEPLMATPLSATELLLAKITVAWLVAATLLAIGIVVFLGLVTVYARPGVAATFLAGRSVALLVGVAPAAALVTLTLGAVISTRARDARAAQQAGVVVVAPLVSAFVLQLNGMLSLGTGRLVVATSVLVVIAALLFALAVKIFDRERMLTDWS